ncbi:beta strand repeat-containing protein [Nostoc sp.]|uniref:beta strand repeat-containing protein n=1 Tax=Nostoc sp. TaxID=1180 RepID=UPI002FF6093D
MTKNYRLHRCLQFGLAGLLGWLIVSSLTSKTQAEQSNAQLNPDNTLGKESSVVAPVDTLSDRIEKGAIRGANLFHSFQEFNIDSGRSVYFANPVGIENILTRITGSNPSNILGKLGVEGAANLFLINPNGIFFGKNASLDIQGAFTATTADEITLGEKGLFSATEPAKSNLLSVQPNALFANALKNQQAQITNQGNLIVGEGNNITLFGANVSNTGILTSQNGTINLTGTEILIVRGNLDTNTLVLNTKNITIAENTSDNSQATIYKSTLEGLSGDTNLILQATNDITINALSGNSLNLVNGSGKVTFNADVDVDGIGNFQMQTADTIKSNGRDISILGASLTLGNIDTKYPLGGGNITLTATEGNISTGDLDSSSLSIYGTAAGNGGEITLTAQGNISTTGDLSSYSSSLLGGTAGNGGEITLTAQGNISTTGDLRSYSSSLLDGTAGNGGEITLTAQGNISTTGDLSSYSSSFFDGTAGNGGEITLTAQGNISTTGDLNSSSSSSDSTAGNGGEITLNAQGNISTGDLNSSSYSSDGTAGNGGGITLTAQGDIKGIRNEYTNELPVISSFSVSQTRVSGQGGNVTLTAKNQITDLEILTLSSNSKSGDVQIKGFGDLSLTNTGIITSKQVTIRDPLTGPNIPLNVGGVGQSGNVTVTSTGDLTFNNSGIQSDTKGSDPAGNITITSPGTVTFNNNTISKITSNTSSQGQAGNIQINANNLVLTDASEISASTTADGKAGDITLNTPTLTVANGGKIFATTTGIGDGGTITINAPNKVNLGIGVQDFTPILSVETSGAGKAGDIIVNTPSLTVSDTARITATATKTATNTQGGGSITLNASKIDLAGIVGVFAETQGAAPAGTLKLNPYQNQPNLDITLFPNSIISASTSASGKGGDLILTAPETINIAGQGKLTVESTGTGNAGNIQITTQKLNINDGVKISASTNNIGKGGNIQVNANNLVLTDASEISASTTADGKAGDITLNTPTLTVANGGKIFATTTGIGDGGTITINAPNKVNLGIGVQDFSPILSVETSGAGKAGDIIVNTPSLTVSDTARITATATKTATNTQGGGSITLNASKIDLAGIVGVFAETQGAAPAGTLKLNPYQNQPDLDITLFPNSIISASTSASGKGGDLILAAPETINIAGKGKLTVETTGIGDAGNIQITTQKLNINDGVKISASTNNIGKGGNIQVNANNLIANNGAQFLTATSGNAPAGNINLQIRDQISLSGTDTGLFANTEKGSIGYGGNINLSTNYFSLSNGGRVSTSSEGQGKAGDININSVSATLDNQGFIAAASNSGDGGNINLTINDLLLLRSGSGISTTAGTAQSGGNGGNIKIDSKYIIAIPEGNSDITANAFTGTGGNVKIKSQGIFGIEARPKLTEKSDITASSEQGIAGAININAPDTSSIKNSFTELPPVIDTNALIANSCISRGTKRQENSFTITGSGALSPNRPGVSVSTYTTGEVRGVETTSRPWKKGDPIIEPTGLYRLNNGQLLLSRECSN